MPKRFSNNRKHRITFIKTETLADELGQVVEGRDIDYIDCWADIKTMLGKEYFAAAAVQAERTYRFIIRFRPGIETTMKIKYKNRIFDITHPPINDGECNETLTIIAKERVL
jgi:SPP1 family predicted phage head-tail adaptor